MRQPAGLESHAAGTSLQGTPGRVILVYIMWVFVWYDPDWLLAALGIGTIFVKLYTVLFIPVCILLVKHFRREAAFWPYLVIIGIHLVWMPFVMNRGFLTNAFGKILQYILLTALTVSVLETPKQMAPLLKLFLLHFLWFGVQGIPAGRVSWHQNLGNEDSYGPFMVMGLAYSYYVAMGATVKKYRYMALAVCFLGVMGTILSFARGAFIGLCIVFMALAVRSPRKMAFLGYGIILVMAGLIVIMVVFPNGEFWDEMASITKEGTTEGTGNHRWVLWQAAVEMFLLNPILGVGPNNFGPNAAEYFTMRGVTSIGGGIDTPGKLYAIALHNDYVQILVEEGLIGLFAFAAVFIYFFGFMRFLRTEAAQIAWASQPGGFSDLNNLALGLESTMLAIMVSSAFYPQIFINWWMWSVMMLALVAMTISRKNTKTLVSCQSSHLNRRLG